MRKWTAPAKLKTGLAVIHFLTSGLFDAVNNVRAAMWTLNRSKIVSRWAFD